MVGLGENILLTIFILNLEQGRNRGGGGGDDPLRSSCLTSASL